MVAAGKQPDLYYSRADGRAGRHLGVLRHTSGGVFGGGCERARGRPFDSRSSVRTPGTAWRRCSPTRATRHRWNDASEPRLPGRQTGSSRTGPWRRSCSSRGAMTRHSERRKRPGAGWRQESRGHGDLEPIEQPQVSTERPVYRFFTIPGCSIAGFRPTIGKERHEVSTLSDSDCCWPPRSFAQNPAISAVVNGASFDKNVPVAAGSLISIFGTALASKTAAADSDSVV